MDIYLLRHGQAISREEAASRNIEDAGRALTVKGRADISRVIEIAKDGGLAPDLILTSPLVRARETAEIAAGILGKPRVMESPALLPVKQPEAVWTELPRHQPAETVILVGHEPQFSAIAAFLLGCDLRLDFKKGALLRIVTARKTGVPDGVLRWMLTPRLARGLDR